MKKNNSGIAERLKEARKNAGYVSAVVFVEKNGLSLSTYRHHENGTRGFGTNQLLEYSKMLGVHPAWLMTGENYRDVVHTELLTQNDIANAANQLTTQYQNIDQKLQRYLFEISIFLSPYIQNKADKNYAIGLLIHTYKTCVTSEKSSEKRLELAKSLVKPLISFFEDKKEFAI
jgi:hypothetical protein